MQRDPRMMLRGLAKLLAVVVAAGLIGAGLGVGLAELTTDDGDASVPAAVATSTAQPRTTTTTTATTTQARTSTSATVAPRSTRPRVEVVDARLGRPSASSGQLRVVVRLRVTNRTDGPLTLDGPVLRSGDGEAALDPTGREAASALLKPISPGKSATGALRFTAAPALATRLSARRTASLRIADRTIALRLRPIAGTTAPTGA